MNHSAFSLPVAISPISLPLSLSLSLENTFKNNTYQFQCKGFEKIGIALFLHFAFRNKQSISFIGFVRMAIGESSMAIGESSMAAHRKEIAAASALDRKNFPVGMRIVAVDDCKISLRLLSKLLSKCEYQVTCFTNAVEALNTIREKKDEIDLVITDVHMPEIDGFQLLEIAGLELDLPVIMLSANDTKESVMKGVMHGACDYLIKPVRIEELRVIWKHVARRRRPLEEFNLDSINNNHETIGDDNAEAVRSGTRARIATGKRRKEDDSDEDDSDEMESERTTKKKARVVWTPDLHRKFVNAVSEIGVDKAVPKSILEKMKVEKLTRENVASHLQKYRLYLKRLNSNPHALEAAFDLRNPFSLDLHSFERFRNFHAHGRYRQAANNTSPFHSTRFNNFSVNSPSPSVMPNLAPSSPLTQIGGFTHAGTNNFTLTNNTMNNNNQMNLLRGVNGMNTFPSTSNSNYFTHANNNTNYLTMTFPPPASSPLAAPLGYPMTNLPPISGPISLLGPQFGARPNLIGNELQQAVPSFNTFGSVPNPSITGNPNNINIGPFINNPATPRAVMSAGMGVGPVRSQGSGGFGGTPFGAANNVADHMSSSSIHSGDDVSISGLDELLASMQPGEGVDSLPFMDDDFFN